MNDLYENLMKNDYMQTRRNKPSNKISSGNIKNL